MAMLEGTSTSLWGVYFQG